MSAGQDRDDSTRSYVILTEGAKVGRYRIIEKIGEGGMGEVYLAHDVDLDRSVALKFLPQYLVSDESAKARFKREAQAAAKLSHTNIVTIFEVGEYQGRPYFAMEHIEGQSLRDLIKREELPLGRLTELTIQICEGLHEAHRCGIVHRDIKPANVTLDKNGYPKLLDFGLAALQGLEHLTKTGSTLGTIGYMSPEQIQAREIDHRSDLFSLGVVLYEMIARRKPFTGDNEAAIMNSVLHDTPEPLSRYKSDVSAELQQVVSKLLDKDPELRYQSAADVIADLKRLSIRVSTTKERPPEKRNRFTLILFAIVLAVVAGYWIITDFPAAPTDMPGQELKVLAVLPFENLGPEENEYFADGVTNEIISKLSTLGGLGVISRKSAYAYKNSDRTLPEIARDLGADYILDGCILWDGSSGVDRIRITPQLVQVTNDRHIWAESYEFELTEVFEIQSEIAARIADALDVTLLDPQRQSLNSRPTESIEAYDFYLRGLDYDDRHEFEYAEEMFQKAIDLDGTFAVAYAALSQVHSYMYWSGRDMSRQRIRSAREAAEKSLSLDPSLTAGHLASGYCHYYGERDYEKALQEFTHVLKSQPSNSEALCAVAYVKRRQGDWEESVNKLERAVGLDPRSISKASNLVITCIYVRDYSKALAEIDRIVSLYPDFAWAWGYKAVIYGMYLGDTAQAHMTLNESYDKINVNDLPYEIWHLDLISGDFEAAVDRDDRPVGRLTNAADSGSYYFNRGESYDLAQNLEMSYVYSDSARACFEKMLELDRAAEEQAGTKMALARSLAGLGRREQAVLLGIQAISDLPLTVDAYKGSDLMRDLALIYVRVGEYDKAIDLLDTLLTIPSIVSTSELRLHPRWASLRDSPSFQKLIDSHPIPRKDL
ncbi:MAG: protein kinase [Candidatus Zixiibacteriota bacterium]